MSTVQTPLRGEITPFDETFEEKTVKLSPDILEFLRESAKARGITTGDMLRIALGTQKFLAEKAGAGAKIQIREKTKTYDLEF